MWWNPEVISNVLDNPTIQVLIKIIQVCFKIADNLPFQNVIYLYLVFWKHIQLPKIIFCKSDYIPCLLHTLYELLCVKEVPFF